MLISQLQEEFDRVARDPRRFLAEEFAERGALYTSFFDANSLGDAKIVLRFSGGIAPSAHVKLWTQYKGTFYRATYLAFWDHLDTEEPWWRPSQIDLSKVYVPYDYTGTVKDLVVEQVDEYWEKAKKLVEEEKRYAAAWYFPSGLVAANAYPWTTLSTFNKIAEAGGDVHVL